MFDVMIVGAGPAGLNAALVLGRCRRRTLICDDGRPRNRSSRGLHGFLTREGIDPRDLLRIGREQLAELPDVELRQERVRDARRLEDGFEIALDAGERVRGRKLILATGLTDELPPVPGAREFFGHGVYHCPYCDGWEFRDQLLAAYGRGHAGLALALELTAWTRELTLCTDGPAKLSPHERWRLECHGIGLREERVEAIVGRGGALECVRFAAGPPLRCRALFFRDVWRQCSDLPARLGCRFTEKGAVEAGEQGAVGVPGLYVAGDAEAGGGMAILAAAEGARAAVAINTELLKEDLARKESQFNGRSNMAESKDRRSAPAEKAADGQAEQNQRKLEVFEEGQPEQGAGRVRPEDLTGTPLGSDPRE